MTDRAGLGARRAVRPQRKLPEGVVERTCKLAERAGARGDAGRDRRRYRHAVGCFNFSFEISDEVGGYMLVVIDVPQPAGMSRQRQLPSASSSCRRACRRVGRSVSHVIFESVSLASSARLLSWQFVRLRNARPGGSAIMAPTYLATPLWLPQIADGVGMAALCFSLCGSLVADIGAAAVGSTDRGGNRESPELQILIVTCLFLGLLTPGWRCRSRSPSRRVLYLLLQGGMPSAQQPRAGELGQHEQLRRSPPCRCSCSWPRS